MSVPTQSSHDFSFHPEETKRPPKAYRLSTCDPSHRPHRPHRPHLSLQLLPPLSRTLRSGHSGLLTAPRAQQICPSPKPLHSLLLLPGTHHPHYLACFFTVSFLLHDVTGPEATPDHPIFLFCLAPYFALSPQCILLPNTQSTYLFPRFIVCLSLLGSKPS